VHRLAPQYAVDPKLALAVISVESAFNTAAYRRECARLMQLIPETAERFGVRRCSTRLKTSRRAGLPALAAGILSGRRAAGVAAYNAGNGRSRDTAVFPLCGNPQLRQKDHRHLHKASHPTSPTSSSLADHGADETRPG